MKKKEIKALELSLWEAADKLRKNIDAAEYKHVVLGLLFLKYISVPLLIGKAIFHPIDDDL